MEYNSETSATNLVEKSGFTTRKPPNRILSPSLTLLCNTVPLAHLGPIQSILKSQRNWPPDGFVYLGYMPTLLWTVRGGAAIKVHCGHSHLFHLHWMLKKCHIATSAEVLRVPNIASTGTLLTESSRAYAKQQPHRVFFSIRCMWNMSEWAGYVFLAIFTCMVWHSTGLYLNSRVLREGAVSPLHLKQNWLSSLP